MKRSWKVGVKGRLKDMSLVDVVQIFNAERRTVAVHLGSEMGYGRVYLKEGEIVHAAYREFTGVEALYQLAVAYLEGGDTAGARREVLRALELAPNYGKAQDLLLRLRGTRPPGHD